MHLRICTWCRRNSEQIRQMRTLSHKQAAAQNELATLGSEARERIAKILDQNNQK